MNNHMDWKQRKHLYRIVDQSGRIINHIKSLYVSPRYSDVTFLTRGYRFLAHKFILAKKLSYFRDLFKSTPNKKEIELDVNPFAFSSILYYIYAGTLDLETKTEKAIGDIVLLAKEISFDDLSNELSEILMNRFNRNNYGVIINTVRQFPPDLRYRYCLNCMDEYSVQIIQKKCFTLLNKEVLADIIKRDTFFCSELDIFKAVMKWSQTHTKEELKFIIPHIRFVLIDTMDLHTHVKPTGVLTDEEFDEVIKQKCLLKVYPHRSSRNFLPEKERAPRIRSLRVSSICLTILILLAYIYILVIIRNME